MSTFDLSEEHQALREAVRALADDKIAPRAAEIDRTAEFPWDVYDSLVKADFHAVLSISAARGAILSSASARTASRSAWCSSESAKVLIPRC